MRLKTRKYGTPEAASDFLGWLDSYPYHVPQQYTLPGGVEEFGRLRQQYPGLWLTARDIGKESFVNLVDTRPITPPHVLFTRQIPCRKRLQPWRPI